jgi:hypothetical protein
MNMTRMFHAMDRRRKDSPLRAKGTVIHMEIRDPAERAHK